MDRIQEIDMYVTNLLVETLPKSQRNIQVLTKLNVRTKQHYIVGQLLLSRSLKNLINGKNDEEIIQWKNEFHQIVKSAFSNDNISVISLLNLAPIVRTLIIELPNNIDEKLLKNQLNEAFDKLNRQLYDKYSTYVTGCFGPVVDDFFSMGKSYKRARELQEYHYTIACGKCAFFDVADFQKEFSLVEYKYLHHFDELIHQEEWVTVYDLLNTIKNSIIANQVNDSKTMYLYKEIFSSSIRYMFKQADKYQTEIKLLNEGIIRFEHLFDDVHEIHDYYMEIFAVVSDINLYNGINPHIKKALHIIQTEYSNPISLDYIADVLNISVAYLSRLFKEEMNYNFKKYLTMVRLDKAKELLINSNKNISTIRGEVGYQTPTQFVRAFKASEGMTPSKFRRFSK